MSIGPQGVQRGTARGGSHGPLHQETEGGRRWELHLHSRLRFQPAHGSQSAHIHLQ